MPVLLQAHAKATVHPAHDVVVGAVRDALATKLQVMPTVSFRPVGTLARQSSWITVLTVAGMGLGFLNMSLLYPRYLPAAEFGLTRLVVSIAIVAAQVAQFGLESTVIRYFPYFRDGTRRHGGLFRLVLLVGLAGAAIAMVVLLVMHERFAVWFNDRSGLYGTYGLVVLPLLLSEVLFLLLRGFSRAVHRSIAPVFLREFILRLMQSLLIALHAVLGMPFRLFLLLFVLTFVLTSVLLVVDLWRAGEFGFNAVKVRLPRRMAGSMFTYSMITMSVGIAGVAAGNVDQMMLAAMLTDGLEKVAYYAVAMFLSSVVMVPCRAMILPALPLLSEAWRKRDHVRIGELHSRSTTVLLTLGTFVSLCIVAGSSGIYSLMSPEYGMAHEVLLILCATNLVNLAGGLGGSIISTSRRYAFDASSGLLYLGLNVVLDYVFILWWGMAGAAWSSLVSMIVVVAWRAVFLWRRFQFWPYDGADMLKILVAAALSAFAWLIPGTGDVLLDAIIRCAVIGVVYWSIVHRTGVAPEVIAQVGKVMRRFRRV